MMKNMSNQWSQNYNFNIIYWEIVKNSSELKENPESFFQLFLLTSFKRDPRKHSVSMVYMIKVQEHDATPKTSENVEDA